MFADFRKRNIRWVLVIYDFLILFVFSGIFILFYGGGGVLTTNQDKLQHFFLSFSSIFLMRSIGKIYHQIWRYGGVQCYLRLIVADICGCILYMALDLILPITTISMSRIISVSSLSLLGSLSMRMMYRYAYKCASDDTGWGRFLEKLLVVFAGEMVTKQRHEMSRKKNIAIVGAGRVGVALAEEILNNRQSTMIPTCFIDSNEIKAGREIHGIPVLPENQYTAQRLSDYGIDEIVIAIPSISLERKQELYNFYQKTGYKIMVYDYPYLRNPEERRTLRRFEIEEVLFRSPIAVTDEKIKSYYKGKTILITGGGGSIGSELARQVAGMAPEKLILLDIYENGVYDLQQELRMKYKDSLDMHLEIVSITNKAGLEKVFETYHPQIVIHAAAHKHVPLMEHNCVEAVINNVFGTLNVVELCEKYDVERFMALSTDKAVNPTNVMGATKRMCEYIMLAFSTFGKVKYSATRFGNVLGSAGSVIPLFKRQIANGGPVTLTDKRIIRYFMTIPEASQLVLQSGAMAQNGELFVLDMGEPVKILDLAESMIRLSGFEPYKDIDIIETGLRPGEKLYEELLVQNDKLTKTDNNLIFIEKEKPISYEMLKNKLAVLGKACESGDDDNVREALHTVVTSFHRPEEVNPEK